MIEYLSSPARTKSPSRSATPSSARAFCRLLRAVLRCSSADRSADQAALSFSASACLAWRDSRSCARRASTWTPDSRLSASSSICIVRTSRSKSAIGSGFDSCCIRSRLAASSSRSMAESGRRRSTMYLRACATAATRAASVICTPWCAWYFSLMPRRMVSDSAGDGSDTITGWKRRANAASFSIARYSLRVVAPTTAISPRAS
mmetsp:Transcript_16230/g.52879  ORF Transcript_16230/g.52879 Transcript_16230/m.52879 type:complete len:204 (-) Transcript_16230:679-1290(-)